MAPDEGNGLDNTHKLVAAGDGQRAAGCEQRRAEGEDEDEDEEQDAGRGEADDRETDSRRQRGQQASGSPGVGEF